MPSSRGKNREGESGDAEVAARLWRQNLKILQMMISDRRMTQSITYAVHLDDPLVA